MRYSEPILPTLQGPLLMPIPTPTGMKGFPVICASWANLPFTWSRALRMPSAACSECRACSTSFVGAFQKAMMQSPIYLSSVPRCSLMITFVSGVRVELIRCVSSWGFSFSAILVKSRISENITDSTRSSPPSFTSSPVLAISFTNSGARYMPKVSFICRRARSVLR